MKENEKYNCLLGKHKNDIVDEVGVISNYYPSDVWIYNLDIGRFGRNTMLYIFFEEEIVFKVEIKLILNKG